VAADNKYFIYGAVNGDFGLWRSDDHH